MKNGKIYDLTRKLGLGKEEIEKLIDNPTKSCKINLEKIDLFDLYKAGGHYGSISIKEF